MSARREPRGAGDPARTRRGGLGRDGRGPVRAAVLVVLLLALVGVGVADRVVHRAGARPAPPTPLASIAPASVESTAWYCLGGTSAPGSAAASTVSLVNTTSRPVTGTMTAVGDTGSHQTVAVSVPGRSQMVDVPGPLVGGNLVATTVDLEGGGVLATESVTGALGWSESRCSRSTAPEWYFASGSTVNGNTLTLSLFNPTTTDAVVDMTFATPAGISQPQPFEGIVVAPGALVIEHVDAYVQDQTSVSSIVQARTGTVVAAELQTESTAGVRGLSLRLGVPTLFDTWSLPGSVDFVGGASATSITVFNPSGRRDRVVVTVHPGRAPPARFAETVGPRSAWVFDTSGQTRIPAGASSPFLAVVRVVRGPGVVVDRTVHAPSSLPGPQFGAVTGLGIGPGEPPADIAVLPGPGTPAHPSVGGAKAQSVSVVNPGPQEATATVWALSTARGLVTLGRVSVPPGSAITLGPSVLGRVGRLPLVVSANRPILVIEDLAPTAGDGVVALAGAGATDL